MTSSARAHNTPLRCLKRNAFTLLEMCMVLLIMSLLAAAALRYATAVVNANKVNATNATLDEIETALLNFRIANNRLPCPASMAPYEGNALFGFESASDTLGTGTGECIFNGNATPPLIYGATTTANDPYKSDALYDSQWVGNIQEGVVPVRTLKLPDKYAYDGWGRAIMYVVDKRLTMNGAFFRYPITQPEYMVSGKGCGSGSNCTAGAILVLPTQSAPISQALTYAGAYVLLSFGKNGHGGIVRNTSNGTLTTGLNTYYFYNAGSTNADELLNCRCDSNGTTAGSYWGRTFIQQPVTTSNTGDMTKTFDDILRFKTRAQLASPQELQ